MVLSAHPTLISTFIYLCSGVRRLAPPCSCASCSRAYSSALTYFYLSVFSVLLLSCRFVLTPGLSLKRDGAPRFPHSVAAIHERKGGGVLMGRCKRSTWNFNNRRANEALHTNPVSHPRSRNDFTLNAERVMRAT